MSFVFSMCNLSELKKKILFFDSVLMYMEGNL